MRLQSPENPNLVFINYVEGGTLKLRSEQTTQSTSVDVQPGENEDEEIITTTVVTEVLVKKLNTQYNTTNV